MRLHQHVGENHKLKSRAAIKYDVQACGSIKIALASVINSLDIL